MCFMSQPKILIISFLHEAVLVRSYLKMNADLFCFSIDTGSNLYVIHIELAASCSDSSSNFIIEQWKLYDNIRVVDINRCVSQIKIFELIFEASTNSNERSLTPVNLIYFGEVIYLIVDSPLSFYFLFTADYRTLHPKKDKTNRSTHFLLQRCPPWLGKRCIVVARLFGIANISREVTTYLTSPAIFVCTKWAYDSRGIVSARISGSLFP